MALRSSGTCCAVRGCMNNQAKLNMWLQQQCFEHRPATKKECPCEKRYHFHRLPLDEEEKRMWLNNLNLEKPPKTLYVCSFHFVDKRPTKENPHPTLWLGCDKPPKRRIRTPRRVKTRRKSDEPDGEDQNEELCSKSNPFCDAQTPRSDPLMEEHNYSKAPTSTHGMSAPSPALPRPVADSIVRSDVDSLFYTGIPLTEFHSLVSCLQPFAPVSITTPVVDQVLMTLMKLRQNYIINDLARQFKTSKGHVIETVGMWIDIMSEHAMDLIWLPRETIRATLPKAFKEHFSNTTCVIDCVESVLQKSKKLDSRREPYHYHFANSNIKYLVAVSPSGVIMFISGAYSIKCSDRYMIQNSGFLDYLRAGDEVMGDRGFSVRDQLEERRVKLIFPTFILKGCQLTSEEVTRCIAHARIHIERAMSRLKLYKILTQMVPNNLVPKTDKMIKICAGLVNLRAELV